MRAGTVAAEGLKLRGLEARVAPAPDWAGDFNDVLLAPQGGRRGGELWEARR